jgi:hypothetical protein
MPEVQEVFRMATQKVQPDPGALERQHRDQRRRVAKKKTAVYALVAALVVAGVVIGISALRSNGGSQPARPEPTPPPVSSPTPASSPAPAHLPTGGALAPGSYVVTAIDPDFDATHRITISVPDGYQAFDGWGILKDQGRLWVSASVVGNVYADPCHWKGTLLDPPVGTHFDALVAALANQPGRRASTPTDVTLAGFAGKHMELVIPAGISLAECDNAQYRMWLDTGGGERYSPFTGERSQLWFLDVDGVPLVIEAAWPFGASAKVQAELIQMVESIQID